MSQQPTDGTVLGYVRDGDATDRHSGRAYRVQLVADANGDHLNATTRLRYSLRRVWN